MYRLPKRSNYRLWDHGNCPPLRRPDFGIPMGGSISERADLRKAHSPTCKARATTAAGAKRRAKHCFRCLLWRRSVVRSAVRESNKRDRHLNVACELPARKGAGRGRADEYSHLGGLSIRGLGKWRLTGDRPSLDLEDCVIADQAHAIRMRIAMICLSLMDTILFS